MFMFVSSMLYELILSVVPYTASIAHVRFLVCMSAFVIVAVPDCSESLWTMFTLVGLLTRVNAHVYK